MSCWNRLQPRTTQARAWSLVALTTLLISALLPQAAFGQTTHDVTVGNNFFSPNDLTIQVGDTVRWNNASGGPSHDVTADDFSFASVTAPGFTFTRTFNTAAEILYHCTVHSSPGRNINQFMNGRITVQGGGGGAADLSLQSINAANGSYAPGEDISIDVQIQNIGGSASGGFSITYYASTDSTITAADTSLGSDNRSSLNAGQSSSFSTTATFPGNLAEGSYFIGAIININDANNANNSAVDGVAITITAPAPQAELVLNSVDAPAGSFLQGANITITAEVENTGDAASGAFTISYYASSNTTITTQDRLLGTENRASLAAGASSSVAFLAVIPANLAAGQYFIGAIVNFNDSNNSNNTNVDATAITVTAVGSFQINAGLNDTWFNPATAGQGFFITVFPDIKKMFLAWFTYDVQRPPQDVTAMLGEPGHRWLTAFGDYSGDTATLEVEITEGGVFDSGDPAPSQSIDGSMTVTFSGCNAGEVAYNIPSVMVSGTVPIQRIALDNVPKCEGLAAAQ